MRVGAQVLSFGCLVLLAGCPAPPEPASPSPDPPAADATPSPELLARWGDAGGPPLPSMVGPAEGHGRAWTLAMGGSPRDYPGPVVRLPAAGDCARVVEGGCSPQRPDECGDRVAAALARGPDLLDLQLSLDEPGADHLARAVARHAADLAAASRARVHVAVPAVPRLDRLWSTFGEADLYRWSGSSFDAVGESGRLGLHNQVLRSLGRRAVLDAPARPKWTGDRTAVLGLHLATGGIVDGPPPGEGEAALAWAEAHPEAFGRLLGRVALVVPVGALRGPEGGRLSDEIAGAARILEAARLPYDPVVLGDGERVPADFRAERFAGHGLVVVAGARALRGPDWETIHGSTSSPVMLWVDGDGEAPPALTASRVEVRTVDGLAAIGRGEAADALARAVEALARDDDPLLEDVRRREGAFDRNDLPPGLAIVPRWAPERGLLVHHLVDVGRWTGRPAKGSRDGFEVELLYEQGGTGDRCAAQWHHPATGVVHELPCRADPVGPAMHLTLPPVDDFPPWSVLTTSLVPRTRPSAPGKIQLRASSSPDWRSPEVQFEIPILDEEQQFAITLPQSLQVTRSEGVEELDTLLWPASLTVGGNRTEAVLTRRGEGLTMEAAMVTTKREVKVALTVTNTGAEPLDEVLVPLCATSRGATPFPRAGHGNTSVWTARGREALEAPPLDEGDASHRRRSDIADPVTAVKSTDGRWVMAAAFESSREAGASDIDGVVCLLSEPRFGPLAPGASTTREGFLYVGPAGDLPVPTPWATAPPPEAGAPDGGWVAACSDAGRAAIAGAMR